MNRQVITIFKKEMRDMIRDRRMLVAAFSFALLGPVFMGIVFMLSRDSEAEERNARLAIAHMEQAPGLVAFLEKREIKVSAYEGDSAPEAMPENLDAVLILPATYKEDLNAGRMVMSSLYIDNGSKTGIQKGREIEAAMRGFSSYIGGIRLTARGIPPVIVNAVATSTYDLAKEGFITQTMSGMFVMLILMAPFIGGLSVAVDTLAGERERHSMQPLLAQPVSPLNVVLGKLMMVSSFSIVGTLMALCTFMLGVALAPAGSLPIALHLDAYTVPFIIVQILPFAVLVAATQLFISIQVKSYKEGQSYISMFMMLPMLMAYLKIFGAAKLPAGAMYLPILSEMVSLSSLIFNGEVNYGHMAVSLAVAVVGVFALTHFTAKKLQSEVMLDAA